MIHLGYNPEKQKEEKPTLGEGYVCDHMNTQTERPQMQTLEGCSYNRTSGMAGSHRIDEKGTNSSAEPRCAWSATTLTSDS